jgi:hypothetical protein
MVEGTRLNVRLYVHCLSWNNKLRREQEMVEIAGIRKEARKSFVSSRLRCQLKLHSANKRVAVLWTGENKVSLLSIQWGTAGNWINLIPMLQKLVTKEGHGLVEDVKHCDVTSNFCVSASSVCRHHRYACYVTPSSSADRRYVNLHCDLNTDRAKCLDL